MDTRLTAVFRDVMDDPTLVISDELSPGKYEKWDSLAHVKLIMALEEEFGIRLTIGEMTSLESVADIKKKLSIHGVN
jgi:acyl carrier protein